MTGNLAAAPVLYSDSIQARAAPNRYRQIGSPYAFLNAIGIDAVLEEVYKGSNIVDVAQRINISIGVFLAWLHEEGHIQRFEDATKMSAEGYLSEAGRLLRNAQNDFELKKATKIADHGRFLASKLDKQRYGQDNTKLGNATGVTFVMHIGGHTQSIQTMVEPDHVIRHTPPEIRTIEGTFAILPNPTTPTPEGVLEPEDIGPFEDAPFIPKAEAIPTYLKGK